MKTKKTEPTEAEPRRKSKKPKPRETVITIHSEFLRLTEANRRRDVPQSPQSDEASGQEQASRYGLGDPARGQGTNGGWKTRFPGGKGRARPLTPEYLHSVTDSGRSKFEFWGWTSMDFPDSRAFAIDFDHPTHRITPENVRDFIDEFEIERLRELGIHPHLMLTGNRSIHVNFFFSDRQDHRLLLCLRDIAGGLVFPDLESCVDSTVSLMRGIRSLHAETGLRAQLLSEDFRPMTDEETLQHLRSIQFTDMAAVLNELNMSEADALRKRDDEEGAGEDAGQAAAKQRPSPKANMPSRDNRMSLSCQKQDLIREKLMGKSSRKILIHWRDPWDHTGEEYEQMISHGIPKGAFNEILVRSHLVLYCCYSTGSKEQARSLLDRVVRIGVDARTADNRLRRVDQRLGKLRLEDINVTRSFHLSEDEVEELAMQITLIRSRCSSVDVELLTFVLMWFLINAKLHGEFWFRQRGFACRYLRQRGERVTPKAIARVRRAIGRLIRRFTVMLDGRSEPAVAFYREVVGYRKPSFQGGERVKGEARHYVPLFPLEEAMVTEEAA